MRLPPTASAAVRALNPSVYGGVQPSDAPDGAQGANRGIVVDEVTISEKAMHEQFLAWLRVHDPPLPYVHSRTDRKSTIQVGWPDVTVFYGGRAIGVEFKLPGQKLTADQEKVHAELRAVNVPVKTCFTVIEAIEFAKECLTAPVPPTPRSS